MELEMLPTENSRWYQFGFCVRMPRADPSIPRCLPNPPKELRVLEKNNFIGKYDFWSLLERGAPDARVVLVLVAGNEKTHTHGFTFSYPSLLCFGGLFQVYLFRRGVPDRSFNDPKNNAQVIVI